jgi:hypothetical protein
MWSENSTEIQYSYIKPLVLESISHSTLLTPRSISHSTFHTPHSSTNNQKCKRLRIKTTI